MSSSNRQPPLPSSALLALDEGRLIDAIKAVREVERLGLAEAQLRVSSYVSTQPQLQERLKQRAAEVRKTIVKWVLIVDAVLIGAALLWFFGR